MSVIGEAAAIIGITSSSFKILDGCIQGFKFISTALQLGKHAVYLRCALLLEENSLLLWAKHSGLSEDNLDKRLNRALIDETLGNLNLLLNDLESLKKRYKLTIIFDDPPHKTDDGEAADNNLSDAGLGFLQQEPLRQERERILKRGKEIQKHVELHKKFWFAVVDKGSFEELLRKVHTLIQGLRDLLNDTQQAASRDDILLLRLQNITLATKVRQLDSLIEALEVGAVTESSEAVLARLKAIKVKEEEDLSKLDTDKSYESELQALIRHQPSTINSSLQPIFLDNLSREVPIGTSGLQAIRKYDGLPVYVEWKRYDWAVRSEESKKKALSSIGSLALLLSAPKTHKFRTLHCMGLLTEERIQRCQFVYSWPDGCDPHVKPRSLQDYLSIGYTPSLTERFSLARELADSLFLLHASGWLHKAFCSRNVLFFPVRTDSDKSLHDPFIVGFEYSRPDIPGQPSEKSEKDPSLDIYRHPEYLSEVSPPFHKIFDIYALGLVLLEIAKWRPLKFVFLQIALDRHIKETKMNAKSIMDPERQDLRKSLWEKCSVTDIENMRSTLLNPHGKNSHAADVAFRAGSILWEVILWCLGRGPESLRKDDESGQMLQEAFFRNVIKRLDQCIV